MTDVGDWITRGIVLCGAIIVLNFILSACDVNLCNHHNAVRHRDSIIMSHRDD
jgi:hypothetical protein